MFKKQKSLCGWNILSKEDNDMIGFLADRLIKEAGSWGEVRARGKDLEVFGIYIIFKNMGLSKILRESV